MKEVRKAVLKETIIAKLKRTFGTTLEEATKKQIYQACALTIREIIMAEWVDANNQVEKQGLKRLYYLSAEFLMGRALVNNMVNLHLLEDYRGVLSDLGFEIEDIEEQEKDAGLGNGGLGRLAACFLDSLSTLNYPATGCSIRYEHGLFKQKIVDGEQVEVDDNWLEGGNIWEVARPEEQVEVKYGGEIEEQWTAEGLKINHINYYSVLAIPYDYPVIGYDSRIPSTLRLWSARAKTGLDMQYFNRGEYSRAMQERELAEIISKVLYPEDNHEQGRLLRLKQFYFFTSATMQHIVRKHKLLFGDLHTLPNYFTVQINDTHPTLAIPELMRILLDEEGFTWDDAYDVTSRMFNYTNHTVMTEALECWNVDMFKELLPRIYNIINIINEKFCEKLWSIFPGDWDRISRMSIVSYDEIRMANLCTAVCKRVNGVSQLHAEILKARLFRDFYIAFPDKFLGITNGVTHRRWLAKSNQALTDLLAGHIGSGFLKDYREMARVKDLLENKQFLDDFMEVKRKNKEHLCAHLKKTQGIEVNADTVFDIHAKRLHEYKRQLLKTLHIIHLYQTLKANPGAKMTPCTFMFAAKASPGYARAKNIIRLILAVAELVNNDPDTKDVLKVVFIENYSVSEAEMMIPAADISEQISTAGMEGSGTGNMKFMMNGAVTLGTVDGANVEIFQHAGEENNYVFGARVEDIEKLGDDYNPRHYYESNRHLARVMNTLVDGTLDDDGTGMFKDLFDSLLGTNVTGVADRFKVLLDFEDYMHTKLQALYDYKDRLEFGRKCLRNVARSGFFSSDRCVLEYANEIWDIK